MMVGSSEGQAEGSKEHDRTEECQPTEDQECGNLIGSDYCKDNSGGDTNRSIVDDSSQIGAGYGEIEMAEPGRQNGPLILVPNEIGNAAVKVIDDVHLGWGRQKVENQTNRHDSGQPRFGFSHGDSMDDGPADDKQHHCNDQDGNRARDHENSVQAAARSAWLPESVGGRR